MTFYPRYRQIAQNIIGDIESGVLTSGARIPSTAELMAEYQVSATVVNQAIIVLVAGGHIEGVPGVGRFVK